MARARNIKPALFSNDELADIEPIGRLLFIGLWTICDYKGNLEYRPKKIKASILPYDDCKTEQLMINLEQSGFVQSYSNSGVIYINIINFTKHQNPHKNERDKGSDIPCISDKLSQLYDLKGSRIKSEKIAINPDNDGTNPADSLILNPDSLSLIPDPTECATSRFDEFYDLYDKKIGGKKVKAKFDKLSQSTVDKIFEVLPAYVASTPNKQYRKAPLVWLNGECWNDEIQGQLPGVNSHLDFDQLVVDFNNAFEHKEFVPVAIKVAEVDRNAINNTAKELNLGNNGFRQYFEKCANNNYFDYMTNGVNMQAQGIDYFLKEKTILKGLS